jgi:hypothetical protein
MPIVFTKPIIPVTWDSEVAVDNPKFWAKLNETSGTAAIDSGSAGLTGSYAASPTLGQPPLINANTSVLFNGTTQYATFATSLNQFQDDTFTMECWVKPTTISNSPILMHVGNNADAAFQGGFNWILSSSGAIAFNTYDAGFVGATTATGLIVAGNTYHLAVKVDVPGNVRFYINGAFEEQVNVAWDINAHLTNPLLLCALQGATKSNFLNGTMDEFVLYPTLLSDARILAHYNAGV